MAQIGQYFGMYIDGERAALATGTQVSIETASDDVTTNDSQGWQEVIPTNHKFSASVDALAEGQLKNLLLFPEDISNAAWTKDSNASATKYVATDPFGQQHAGVITWGTGGFVSQNITGVAAGQIITASFWVAGSGSVRASITDGGGTGMGTTHALTGTLTRISVTYTCTVGGSVVIKLNKVSGTAVTYFGAMANLGSILLDYKGSSYKLSKFVDAQKNRTKIAVRYSTDITGDVQFAGYAYILKIDVKTEPGKANRFTASLEGTGELTPTTV
jgi:hypothetical protein